MLKIILIIATIVILGIGVFFWFSAPKNKFNNPILEPIDKVLGFSTNPSSKNPISQAKDSVEQNAQNTIENTKDSIYNSIKTSLDNVFNKTDNNSPAVEVSVQNNVNPPPDDLQQIIDLATNTSLNLDLSVNKKYYLKFKNLPKDYCIYINGQKYPLTEDTVEIQFTQGGKYPIKTNSCNINDKNIGTLTVQ